MSGFAAAQAAAFDAAGRAQQRQLWQGMGAYERHKRMMHDLATVYGGRGGGGAAEAQQQGPAKSDWEVLREQHRFIRSEADDASDSWEVRLAKRYYAKLFKEYAVADLSRHKEGKVGLRWRTQKEVVSGKGQFSCGAVGCNERRGLASFEVPFAYEEAGERRQALVKVRVCPTHAYQLNYRKHKEAEEAAGRRREKQSRREQRRGDKRTSSDGGGSKRKRRRRSRRSSSNESSGSQDEDESRERRRRNGRREGEEQRGDRSRSAQHEQPAAGAAAGVQGSEELEFDAFLASLMDPKRG